MSLINPRQANSRERLQRAIDAEIQSLKYRRNALSPVSSLPPELFAAIFSILCLPGTSSQNGKTDHNIARLRVSHVCHQWRQIALNLSFLWRHADFTSESLSSVGIAEMLIRAKSSPLYLEANISSQRWDNNRLSTFRKVLQAHVPQMGHLRISAESALLQGTLEGLVSSAPTLEHLSLSSTSKGSSRRIIEERSQSSIPDTLFDSSTPRLSCLELRKCNINWRLPLLKGLKCLEILKPSANARPELAVWLAALDEMPQLTTLTLHSASPIAPPFPFVVRHTVTLPSLAHLDISGSAGDCALALGHLVLPALTRLYLISFSSESSQRGDLPNLLQFIVQHAHGPQDTQPLQSVLIRSVEHRTDILAWPVPILSVEVNDLHTLPTTTPPTRVALSFRSEGIFCPFDRINVLDMMMARLPMDDLVMLAAHGLMHSWYEQLRGLQTQHFWHHLSPMWPRLQCVRLAPDAAPGFIAMLLEDWGKHKMPMLPSLTQLVMVNFSLYSLSFLPLYDALKKRVEEGVPVKVLDLRMCRPHPDGRAEDCLRSLSKIVVDVLPPEQISEATKQIESIWDTIARSPFDDDDSTESYHSDRSGDDDEDSEE